MERVEGESRGNSHATISVNEGMRRDQFEVTRDRNVAKKAKYPTSLSPLLPLVSRFRVCFLVDFSR